jgi:hypothetical protein
MSVYLSVRCPCCRELDLGCSTSLLWSLTALQAAAEALLASHAYLWRGAAHIAGPAYSSQGICFCQCVMYRVVASRAFVAPAAARARIAGATLRAPSRDTRLSQLFLAATALSLLTPSRGMAASANGQCANPQGEVPSNIQAIATDILRV